MTTADQSEGPSQGRMRLAQAAVAAPPAPASTRPARSTGERLEPRAATPLHPLIWLALVLLATLAVYGWCVGHYFFLDDFWHLTHAEHTQVKDLWRPWVYSGDDYRSYWFAQSRIHGMREPGFFRPLVTVVYVAGLHLWGAAAGPFHAVNVAAHLASTAILFWLAWRLLDSARAAALAALLYGVHPCHYEAVEWIAANADALVTVMGLLCIASFHEALRRRSRGKGFYALALLGFALALGSKEMAVTIPAVLLGLEAWDWAASGGRLADLRNPGQAWALVRRRIGRHLPFWLLLAAYLAWRIPDAIHLMALKQGGNYAVSASDPQALPCIILNFAFYVLHFFALYPIFPVRFSDALGGYCWWAVVPAMVLLVTLGAGLMRAAGRTTVARRACALGIWWLTATLLPFCFLTPGQRVAHFPSAGFALVAGAVALGVARRLKRPAARAWAGAAAAAGLAIAATASLCYTSTLGYVTGQVHRAEAGLAVQLHDAPPGSQVYLINLWQPAWMFEQLVGVNFPDSRFDVQVLSFDPVIVPAELRPHPNVMVRWFMYCFPEQAYPSRTIVSWPAPHTLVLRSENHVFFRGIVEEALPVAAEARRLGTRVDAGAFSAEPSAGNDRGPTEIIFRFKDRPAPPSRLFLYWSGQQWERIAPPATWEAGATTAAP